MNIQKTTEQAYPTNIIFKFFDSFSNAYNCITTVFSTEQEQLSFFDAYNERDCMTCS
jgi:hypothetical protein